MEAKNAVFLIVQESKIKNIQGHLHHKYKNSIKKQQFLLQWSTSPFLLIP